MSSLNQRTVQGNWKIDDQQAWEIHDKYTCHFYKKISLDGQYTAIRGRSDPVSVAFQKMGIDVITTSRKQRNTQYWDEKADFHDPNNFCLEEYSNTSIRPWTYGWMRVSKVDWLLYNFLYIPNIADIFTLNFHALQDFYWSFDENGKPIRERYRPYLVPNTSNHSYSRIVPVRDVLLKVEAYHYLVSLSGDVVKIPLSAPAMAHVKDGGIIKPTKGKVTPLIPSRLE